MTYLVTGGTGFIGSYVVRDLLNMGEKVVCFQRSGVTPLFRQVVGEANIAKAKIIQADISNTLQLFDTIQQQGVDIVVHTSYQVHPESELRPAYALQVNCCGFNHVLEAARLFHLKRVVWTSSSRAFGRLSRFYNELVGNDEALYMPDDFYSATKALDEFMAKLYFEKFGVDSIGIRLPRVYGVIKWHGAGGGIFSEFLKKAALNMPAPIGDPNFATAYLYVEDAADVLVKACKAPPTKTRIFNVEEGRYTNRQIAETVRKINVQAQVTLDEGTISKAFRPPRLETTQVQTELGWQPKYTLETGLRIVLNYFRQKEGMPLL